jgi:hypothetical protein
MPGKSQPTHLSSPLPRSRARGLEEPGSREAEPGAAPEAGAGRGGSRLGGIAKGAVPPNRRRLRSLVVQRSYLVLSCPRCVCVCGGGGGGVAAYLALWGPTASGMNATRTP